MPRLPIDYSRTVIYRISCNDLPEFIYIGSTTDFVNRKRMHKKDSIIKDFKLYQTIRENGGWDNWRMFIIEEYSDCTNNIEQRIREQKWIDELNANLNMLKAYTSEEQKKFYHKEYQKEYRKEYIEQNREKLLQKMKEYREQNREKINQRNKEYREQNREKINQIQKEKRQELKNSKSAK